jgi:hypothetical protein
LIQKTGLPTKIAKGGCLETLTRLHPTSAFALLRRDEWARQEAES